MQMSLLADLPNQITQVIENAVGAAAEGEEKKKIDPLIGHTGIPGSSRSVGGRGVDKMDPGKQKGKWRQNR